MLTMLVGAAIAGGVMLLLTGVRVLQEYERAVVFRFGRARKQLATPGFNLLLPSEWVDPADTVKNIQWTKDTYAAVSEHLAPGRWLNYLGDDQADDAIRAAYGPNYDRLRELKRRYDPGNVFHLNHNIVP